MKGDHRHRADMPSRRIVLLGASNLLRGFSTIVGLTGKIWDEPLEIVAAMGHGRSYGAASSVLGRKLPSILSCGLWDALKERDPTATVAVITDVGNDLLYEAPVTQISQWVEKCLERLAPLTERIVLIELPLASIATLDRGRYFLLRSVFFPQCRLSLDESLTRAQQLNEAIIQLAAQFDAVTVIPLDDWYGLDPIHIQYCRFNDAWRQILAMCADCRLPQPASGSLRRAIYLRCLRPQQRRLFGVEQQRSQPVGRLSNGSTIALY